MNHSPNTIQKFLELRALGQTLFAISDELKVPISTLGDWNKRYAAHLNHQRAVKWEHCENGAGLHIEADLIRLARRIYTCELELGRRPLQEMKTTELMKLLSQTRREYFRRRDPFLAPLTCSSRRKEAHLSWEAPICEPISSAYAANDSQVEPPPAAAYESDDAQSSEAGQPLFPPPRAAETQSLAAHWAALGQGEGQTGSSTLHSKLSALNSGESQTSSPFPFVAQPLKPWPIQTSTSGHMLPPSPRGCGREASRCAPSCTRIEGEGQTSSCAPTQDSRLSTLDSSSPSPRLSASAVQSQPPHPEISGTISGCNSQSAPSQQLTTPEISTSDFRLGPFPTPFRLAPIVRIADMVGRMKCSLIAFLFLAHIALAGLPDGVANTQQAKDKPLSPAESLQRMTLPPGFRAQLFAAEPDVCQPIAFDFDDRGRLWVVECFSYPDFKRQDSDRVLIFTDDNGDGKFDQRKVFLSNGHRFSGITLGFGGVWLCSPPNLLFIPDANGDDIADGQPVIHLDGFTRDAQHNMMNGLAWGPDGWLYGRHGILRNSLVGPPGAAAKDRVLLNCSIWRYHPTRKTFEVVAHGATNPWGLDWDEHGQPFFSNNVIGHMWHLIHGAHYQRMYGEDFNPHFYQLMKASSDHLHWQGGDWTRARGQSEHNQLGGGHSHCGLMIYQGDNWPDQYRQTLMMANIHGNRLLFDRIERDGSGYVAKHGANFLMANDPWFRSTMCAYGPDGGVFVTDWNDFGECHDNDGVYRSSGRIYKITYGNPAPAPAPNLTLLPDSELIKLQLHKNDWFVRHARRLLQERHSRGKLRAETRNELQQILNKNPDITRKLRALWALHVTGGIPDAQLATLLRHQNEHIRWWSLKIIADEKAPQFKTQILDLASRDPSPFVRLGVASALQRLPHEHRFPIVRALLQHSEDAADPYIPLLTWYGLEPALAARPSEGTSLLADCRIPLLRQFISRRLAAAYQLSRR